MTDKQRIAFFRLFSRACARQGVAPGEREAWRHALIREAVPTSGGSLRAVGTGADCDRLMAAVARLAEDHCAAMRWGTAEGRRLAAMAQAAARQCFEIAQAIPALAERCAPGPVAYLRGAMAQASWRDALHAEDGEWWLDLDAVRLGKLFQMLDTHRRRLLRRVPCPLREETPEGALVPMRRAFCLRARYVLTLRALVKTARPPERPRGPLFRVRFVAGGGVGGD